MRAMIMGVLGLFLAQAASAMEVKGLTLGAHTSLKALSAQFGRADCPDPQTFARMDAVLPDMSGTRTLECHVPTSYLGFSGTATVYVDRGFVIKGLVFAIPADQEEAVSATLEQKYGAPTHRKGDPLTLESVGPGPKTTSVSKYPCTIWQHVQDASVQVCAGQVTYTYVGATKVNAKDL